MIRRFLAACDGGVAIIAAAAMGLMLVGMATASDIAVLVNTKTHLQVWSDAASLAAAKAANSALVSAGTSASTAIATSAAQIAANQSVIANAQAAGLSTIPDVSIVYTPKTQYSGSVAVTLSQTPSLLFVNILPAFSQPISVSSTSTMIQSNTYLQVIFLVDISNSMTVGGTENDIQSLLNSSNQCAFACHDTNGYYGISRRCSMNPVFSGSTPPCDVRSAAKAAGINLKIDYVNQAMQNFTSQLNTFSSSAQGFVTVSMMTFGTSTKTILAPTTSMSAAQTAASNIDVENATPYYNSSNNPYAYTDWVNYNGGYTKTTQALNTLVSQLTNVGDGSSITKKKTYIIFLSDGVQDVYGTNGYVYHTTNVNYTDACANLKNAGAKLFSIWVPYYSQPNNTLFQQLVEPISGTGPGTMQGAMQQCATSSSEYFAASDGPAIIKAFTSALNVIVNDSALHISK